MDKAMSVLDSAKKEKMNADEMFGQSVGLGLQNIRDHRSKEFAKVKIQEVIFKAQFDLLGIPAVPETQWTPMSHYQIRQTNQGHPHQQEQPYLSNPLSPLSSQQIGQRTPSASSSVMSPESSPTIPYNSYASFINNVRKLTFKYWSFKLE